MTNRRKNKNKSARAARGNFLDKESDARQVEIDDLEVIDVVKDDIAEIANALDALELTEEAKKKISDNIAQPLNAFSQAIARMPAGTPGKEMGDAVDKLLGELTKSLIAVSVEARQGADGNSKLEGVADAVSRLAGHVRNITYTLQQQGVIGSGNMVEDLRAGKLFVGKNSRPIDLLQVGASLMMLRNAKLVRELDNKRATSIGVASTTNNLRDRLYTDEPEARFILREEPWKYVIDSQTTANGVSTVVSHLELTYDPSWMTHLFGFAPYVAGATGATMLVDAEYTSKWVPFLTAIPAAVAGTVYTIKLPDQQIGAVLGMTAAEAARFSIMNAFTSSPRVATIDSVRATHDLTSLVTIAAMLGIESAWHSALLTAAPLFSETLTGFVRQFTSADSMKNAP